MYLLLALLATSALAAPIGTKLAREFQGAERTEEGLGINVRQAGAPGAGAASNGWHGTSGSWAPAGSVNNGHGISWGSGAPFGTHLDLRGDGSTNDLEARQAGAPGAGTANSGWHGSGGGSWVPAGSINNGHGISWGSGEPFGTHLDLRGGGENEVKEA